MQLEKYTVHFAPSIDILQRDIGKRQNNMFQIIGFQMRASIHDCLHQKKIGNKFVLSSLFHFYSAQYDCALCAVRVPSHMEPEDNFCSTKISKDSVLAKLLDLM